MSPARPVFTCFLNILVNLVIASLQEKEPTCLSRFDYDYKMLTKLVDIEAELNDQKVAIAQLLDEKEKLTQTIKEQRRGLLDETERLTQTIQEQRLEIDQLSENLSDTKNDLLSILSRGQISGTTYVRWGRTSCPENGTDLVYHGYAAGSWYIHSGGAANFLCLPRDPIWGHYEDSQQSNSAYVYGVEYELNQRDLHAFFKTNIRHNYEDAPCAVCRTKRPSILMIPGRNQCYSGWNREYAGYLVSGFHSHSGTSEYICLDENLEHLTGGIHSESKDGKLLYFTEARCGSLPCPPYVEGRELTCVVCSK